MPSADTGERIYEAQMRVTVGLGTVEATSSAPMEVALGGLAELCDIDPEVDAYLPLRATLRNDSPFPTTATLALRVNDLLYGR